MAKVSMPMKLVLATCLSAVAATDVSITFTNSCPYEIDLFHSQSGSAVAQVATIESGSNFKTDITGPAHMYRHTSSQSATLFEISIDGAGIWYDISIIPPGPGNCECYETCKAGNKTGFNVPMEVTPGSHVGSGSCNGVTCAADDKNTCAGAYLFPSDDSKTHTCPLNTGSFEVTFCFESGSVDQTQQQEQTQQQSQTQQQTQTQHQDQKNQTGAPSTGPYTPSPSSIAPYSPPPSLPPTNQSSYGDSSQNPSGNKLSTVKAKYAYKGKNAGNVAGTYNRVTDLASCTKESVSVNSPVGPMSEPVTMIFRGPMKINNIAVYSDSKNNGTWSRVSSYSKEKQTTENLVFMNNKNVDYSGKHQHGPQGLSTANGNGTATTPTVFAGELCDAIQPTAIGGGAGISTGEEINIMTSEKCDAEGCLGYYGDNNYKGWAGGKKMFVTEVQMYTGMTLNRPAIWMLNAQVIQTNQYGCNCRGMGAVGGCGELDIAEVIETNIKCDALSTHYYFYDGEILSPAGDNFTPRSTEMTVFVTLIDESNGGLIKIVQLSSFDFSITVLGSLYEQLINC